MPRLTSSNDSPPKAKFPIYPVVGIVSALLFTLAAVYLIPEDPGPEGALRLSAIVMSAGLIVAPLLAMIKNLRALLRSEHLVVLSPIYWLLLDPIQSAYPMHGVSSDAIKWTFWAICLFVCGVWLATWMRPWRLPSLIARSASYVTPPRTLFKLILVFFFLGMLRFAIPCNFNPITMVEALSAPRWLAPWARGQLGGWDSFLDHMSYFGYLLPTLTVMLVQKRKWLSAIVVVSIALSLIMTAFLAQGGGRRIIGVVIGSALICWVIQHRVIRFRVAVGLIVGVVSLLAIMQLMLEVRTTGVDTAISDSSWKLESEYLHIDDNFLRMSQVVDIVPDQHQYIYEKQIIFILIRPIPRVLWPGKPIDAGFDLPGKLEMQGLSLSFSAIGEFYLSAGMIAVLLGGFFYGKLARMISVLLVHQQGSSALVYSIGAMTLIAGMRSMQDLILMSYSILGWAVVSFIFFRISPSAKARFDVSRPVPRGAPGN